MSEKEEKTEKKSFWDKVWDFIVDFIVALAMIALIFELANLIADWKVFRAEQSANSAAAVAVTQTSCNDCKPSNSVGDTCYQQAEAFKIPSGIADYICTMPQNNPNVPEQMKVGQKISFGSITFNNETRVWVLRNFIVPAKANYSFDHSGRERRILGAGFYTGAELNAKGGNFTVCYNVTDTGCIPPTAIEFFN